MCFLLMTSVSKRSASRCSETSQTLTEEPEVIFSSISFCLSGWLCFCLFFLFVKDKHSQILFPQVKWFEQQRELRRVKRDVPIEQHVKKRDFGDGPDPVKLTFEKIPSNINYLFSRNSATGWRTISGTESLPRWKEKAQKKLRRENDRTALLLPSATPCSGFS